MKITKNAWDSNIIQSNGKYLSVNWDASGGGAFAVIPLNEVGKAPDQVPLFRGHKGPVLDTAFDPFNEERVVSCSDDGKILLWTIPKDYSFHKYVDENDEIKDITEPTKVLSGHTRKVGRVLFHPCAQNVLASLSLDYSVKIWNVETGKAEITLQHKDLVTSFAFNYNGTLLVTTSRDKKLRIWDIRSGKIVSEGPAHTGAKPSRVAWLGNTDRIVTTGFSRLSDRQVGIWNVHDIEAGPIDGFMVVDSSSGVLIPIFDESTNILYLAGKGDGNIRYYEYDSDYLHDISEYASNNPQRGFAAAPKLSVNVKENEILKSFKTVNDHYIEPVSFHVPRRSELFQEDIFPDCPSSEPALSADEFFAGKESNGPLLMSMEALYEGTEPVVRESDPVTVVSAAKEEAAKKEEVTKKEEAVKKAETKKEEVVTKKVEEPKDAVKPNVDQLLKTSSLVNDLLNKVNDQSDNEEVEGEDWEEVKKPSPREITPKPKEVTPEPKEVPKPKEVTPVPKEAPKSKEVTPKPKEVTPEPKESPKPKDVTPVLKKEETPASSPVKATAAATPAAKSPSKTPTLTSVVERLHGLVEKLEGQLAALTESSNKKDDRIEKLENALEKLLEKAEN